MNTDTLRARALNSIRGINPESVSDPLYALGIAYDGPYSAGAYLHDLFAGQRPDGFIPHFAAPHPEAAAPPVFGFLAEIICQIAKDKELIKPLLRQLYPKILAFHDYLYRNRDADEDGILYSVHPAESYFTYSPQWDSIDEKNARVQCPLYNALAVRSAESMIELGRIIGADVTPFVRQNELAVHSLNDKLWNEVDGVYHSFDLNENRQIDGDTAANLLPLIAWIPMQEQTENMLLNLNDEFFRERAKHLFTLFRLMMLRQQRRI